ncbi:MAG: hypothetical protein EPN22_00400 [Nitrospirae bacterium]|nr:MAG: hypothetical protein EPN22_00400 [Nitrospirota bacterium]
MPHRAGYFVLAYQWDHHCDELLGSIRNRLHNTITRLVALERIKPACAKEIRAYYTAWNSCNEDFSTVIEAINKRQETIHNLGYRGYGVNMDLLKALEDIKNEYGPNIRRILKRRFEKYLAEANALSGGTKRKANAAELVFGLGIKTQKTGREVKSYLRDYFRLKKETGDEADRAILQKLFLGSGGESVTIMKGSIGRRNIFSEKTLKLIGNKNLMDLCRNTFSGHESFNETGTGLLKKIHYMLSADIDPNAGDFRQHDFEDKNGVTVEFGNFDREIRYLDEVLRETTSDSGGLEDFIAKLSTAYYMFLGIHPFRDSNGRVGRCFANYLLLKKGLPPAILGDQSEILALPRYGGTIGDMHYCFKQSIRKAADLYSYERSKLKQMGLLPNRISNVSFDSGFNFRVFEGKPALIEINFPVFLIEKKHPLHKQYLDECRIVFEDEAVMRKLALHYGFSEFRMGEWDKAYDMNKYALLNETPSPTQGIKAFDMVFIIKTTRKNLRLHRYFNCCVSAGNRDMFNNKGLNYSFGLK